MAVTLEQNVLSGDQASNYPEWKTSSEGRPIGGLSLNFGGIGDAVAGVADVVTGGKAKSKFSKFLNNVKNALLGGFINNSAYVGVKYFGDDPAYTAGDEKMRDVGRFVGGTEHQKRFRLGNEWGAGSNNDVFVQGFEDPAFLTFKIEFGEWGATLCDNGTIASVQKDSIYSNTWKQNYDTMPMGLLDLNFMGEGENFNS